MTWWLGVFVASLLITLNNMILRAIGFRPWVALLLLPLLIGAQLGYNYAYAFAPKFIQAWFLGTGALAILGVMASYLTARSPALRDLVGIGCIVLGGYLLVRGFSGGRLFFQLPNACLFLEPAYVEDDFGHVIHRDRGDGRHIAERPMVGADSLSDG